VLKRPASVHALVSPDDVNGLGETLVAARVDGLEVIEGAEDVVVPPRGE
jgi:hypothetical protein